MTLRHRFPNLSVIGSLSLLGIVTQQHPTRAETEIPENIPFDKILAVETNLPSKVLPPPRSVIYSREQAQHNTLFTAQSVIPCSFSNTNLLCFNPRPEKSSPTDKELFKSQEKLTQEPKSKSLSQLMMEKSKNLESINRERKVTQNNQKLEQSSPYSLRPYESKSSNLPDSLHPYDSVDFVNLDSTPLPTRVSPAKTFRVPYSLRSNNTNSSKEELSEKTSDILDFVELWQPGDNNNSSKDSKTTSQEERDNTILESKKKSKEEDGEISEVDITPVSQLDNIQPSDWAFQALYSLSDRYGINKANPNSNFRGNRALTRYEFASALQTTIEQINELMVQGNTSVISRDDLAILERLQEEFAAELTKLQGRVDTLEVRTSELQANQFSTTTKLTGQVIFGVTGGSFSGERIVDVTGREITTKQPNPTFVYRAALDFNTSFSGSDLLKIRLDAGSDGADDNAAGFLEPSLGSVLDFAAKPPVEQFGISRLLYTFSPLRNVTLSLGPKIVLSDYIDTNRYANLSFLDFSTQAFVNNYLLFPVQGLGAGAVISWNPGDGAFTARAGYVAAAANEPTSRDSTSFVPGIFPIGYTLYPNGGSTGGLFGDPHQGIAEVEYAPSKNFAVRLQYAFGNILGGQFNVFGANFELALSDRFGVFGRYGRASYKDTAFGDINPTYWMLGLAFPDLFVRGAKAGIAIGQPFISRDVGNATQTNFEAFYNYPISNSIQIAPVVQVITNPGNQESNGTVITGTLRTVFSF
ncbi:iron uptake porin [Scytonema sp. NUACC26]|uniref:iron uptake porin n=1 Tax=Scytonema sp. NUACC26 TaxID=3140176 RepID=UPI0034DBDCC1